jgi:hypothetical protein
MLLDRSFIYEWGCLKQDRIEDEESIHSSSILLALNGIPYDKNGRAVLGELRPLLDSFPGEIRELER